MPQPDLSGYFDDALAAARVNGARVDALEEEPAPPSVRERMMSLADLRNIPPPTPIVEYLIDFDSLVLAYGKRAGAKSFGMVDLTASVSTGTRWHGRRVEIVPSIYVVAESVGGVLQRYDAWFAGSLTQPPAGDRLLILPEPVNLLDGVAVDEFAAAAGEMGARLIVFDTLARCMVGGDENSARDAGIAVSQLDVIRRRTGACVIAVHHAGKDTTAGARGSSAFEAAADTVLEFVNADGLVTINCTKQKNHAAPNPVRLQLVAAGASAVLEDYRGDVGITAGALVALASLSAVEVPGGVAASVWALSFSGGSSTFFRHRKDLLTLGLVSNVGTEKMPRYQVSDAGTLALSLDSQ